MMRLHSRRMSRAFLIHRNEWSVAFVILIVFLSVRLDKAVENARAKVKLEDELSYFKKTHQAERIKEWVTSQYCIADLEILCPNDQERPNGYLTSTCDAVFDPPLRFVLDLPATTSSNTIRSSPKLKEGSCSLTELIKQSNWHDHDSINEYSDDDVLTYFIAHVLEQVRSKSVQYFRSEKDRSIEEFEQSRLIESALASITNLFSLPTVEDEEGNGLSTKAIDLKITKKMWPRQEVISLMHDAVLWHTHHKRNGATAAGAVLRVSRQQPSFVFNFLPLVKEQIQNLELDNATQMRVQRLYSTSRSSTEPTTTTATASKQQLHDKEPEEVELSASDQCLWAHYEEGCLISHDCMLALESAPLMTKDIDRAFDLPLILVHVYTIFSAALLIWMVTSFYKQENSLQKLLLVGATQEMEILCTSNRNLHNKPIIHEYPEEIRIRTMQKVCLGYLAMSCVIGLAANVWVPTLQFSDFLDGLCLGLLGFLSLHVVPYTTKPPYFGQCSSRRHENKSSPLLDPPPTDRHYKKRSSMELHHVRFDV